MAFKEKWATAWGGSGVAAGRCTLKKKKAAARGCSNVFQIDFRPKTQQTFWNKYVLLNFAR